MAAFAPHCLLTALYAPLAQAGDFLDVRLSMNLVDENVLVKPGETVPSIPGLRFGTPIPRWGLFFFDNTTTALHGYENLTNLVLYKDITVGQEEFDGALVLRFSRQRDSNMRRSTTAARTSSGRTGSIRPAIARRTFP